MKPVILPAPNELFFSDLYKLSCSNCFPNFDGVEFHDDHILIKLRHYMSSQAIIVRVNESDYKKYFTPDEPTFDKTDIYDKTDIPIYTL